MRENATQRLWRIFCAVELPEEVKALAAAHIARLRVAAPPKGVSWDRPEKLHITLKFLGDLTPERAHDLSRAAEGAASCVEPFTLRVEGTGAFPPRGLPRVLWLGVRDDTGRLAGLQRRLEDECARESFPREPRAFHPHLTVARLRQPAGARELAEAHRAATFETPEFVVGELVVMRSELRPEGSRYTALSRHRLGGERWTAAGNLVES